MASKLGWKWIFWMLVILGGVCLALLVIALPETSRAVVGNGSVPPHGIYSSLILMSKEQKGEHKAEETIKTKRITFPNPLASLKILLSFRLSNVLVCNGIAYTVYCCIQASLSSLFIDVYGYHDLEAGLIYIPFGVACLVSTLIWGTLALPYLILDAQIWQAEFLIASTKEPPSATASPSNKPSPDPTLLSHSKLPVFEAVSLSSQSHQQLHAVSDGPSKPRQYVSPRNSIPGLTASSTSRSL